MSWGQDGVVTSLGVRLEAGVPVQLRGSLDKVTFLTIGDEIEIVLKREHVRALQEQTAAALGDMARLDAAEEVLVAAFDAGAQARTAAERALEQVEAAERAGAVEEAEGAREAARTATEAAERAQQAVRSAAAAMGLADEAAEAAVRAAATAARAAGEVAGTINGDGARHTALVGGRPSRLP